SPQTLSVFFLFGEGCGDPLFLLPGWVAVLFSCVGEVGGTTVARKGLLAHNQRRGNRRPGERAAPPATGFPAPPTRNEGRLCSALLRVFPGTVCRGNPRTPCTGTRYVAALNSTPVRTYLEPVLGKRLVVHGSRSFRFERERELLLPNRCDSSQERLVLANRECQS